MKPRIVIVGAGFVGLLTARRLAQRLKHSAEVVLINEKDHFLFTPLLIDVLHGSLPEAQAQADLKKIAERDGFWLIQGHVTHIDRIERCVTLKQKGKKSQMVMYDRIVLCQGSTTNYFGTEGAEQYTLPCKELEHAKNIHARIHDCFALAKHAPSKERKKLLSFVVIGGGAAGVEVVFALKAFVESLPQARTFANDISFTIIEAGRQLLNGFPAYAVACAMQECKKQGVRLLTADPVKRVTAGGLTTATGQTIEAGLMVWACGVKPIPIEIEPIIAKNAAGWIVPDSGLHVDCDFLAAGDTISFAQNNVIVPKNAQTARHMAFTVIENVLRSFTERQARRFYYYSRGAMISMGNTGVIDVWYFSIKTRFTPWLRRTYYRFMFRHLTGNG
jgi:NADH:ubiquinone reductase (H+-translocating)